MMDLGVFCFCVSKVVNCPPYDFMVAVFCNYKLIVVAIYYFSPYWYPGGSFII